MLALLTSTFYIHWYLNGPSFDQCRYEFFFKIYFFFKFIFIHKFLFFNPYRKVDYFYNTIRWTVDGFFHLIFIPKYIRNDENNFMFMVISSDIYNTHINWDIMVKRISIHLYIENIILCRTTELKNLELSWMKNLIGIRFLIPKNTRKIR